MHFLHGITVAGVVNGGWTPIWRKFLTVACQPHPTAAQLSSLERRALEAIKLHLSLRLPQPDRGHHRGADAGCILIGMPLFYKHWSFGKHFAHHEAFYRKGLMGLAYEIVINSSPCISYLMEEKLRVSR